MQGLQRSLNIHSSFPARRLKSWSGPLPLYGTALLRYGQQRYGGAADGPVALGIGPGDAVFVPDFTFFATSEAVSLLGAEPGFLRCACGHL